MTTIVRNVALGSLAAALLACGGGSGKGSRSGVTPSKILRQATEEDVQRLCEWLGGPLRVVPTQEQMCTLYAVDTASNLRRCEELVQSCLEDNGRDGNEQSTSACPFSVTLFSGCDQKVSELEDCYSSLAKQSRARLARLSCEEPFGGPATDPPAACQRLADECPRVFDDVGDPGPGELDFECEDGSLVANEYVCDGFNDCEFGEDETCGGGGNGSTATGGDNGFGTGGSTSGSGFLCNDGREIPQTYVCDGFDDCDGSEDEDACGGSTGGGTTGGSSGGTSGGGPQFTCRKGETVSQEWVCDGTRDCSGGEDEKTCDGGFVCNDGFDISDQWKCDTRSDCSNGEDEANCP